MSSQPPTPPPRDPTSERTFRFHELGTPCEWAESYHPGGFHPVHFGDVFNDRYEVIRKLGHGSFGTVWLAWDYSLSRYVALKVEVAKLYGSGELSIQNFISEKAPQDHDSQFIVQLLDSFVHEGPNGKHQCLVLEPMGPSLSSVLNAPVEIYDPLNPSWPRFPKHQTRAILRNVLCGLQFLHANGVVHGDLQSGNILFALQDLGTIGREQLQQDKSNSQIDSLHRLDGKPDKWAPSYLAVAKPLSDYTLPEEEQVVKIADMGGAFLANNPPNSVVTPAGLRAPELILNCHPTGFGIDIWSLGCLLFEFLTGQPLFQIPPIGVSREGVDDGHLIQLTDIIHPLPEDMIKQWPRASKYYGPSGERLDSKPWHYSLGDGSDDDTADWPDGEGEAQDSVGEDEDLDECEDEYGEEEAASKPYDSLEKFFKDSKPDDIGEEEEREIVALLRWIFEIDPLKRPSARGLLEHPWIKGDNF